MLVSCLAPSLTRVCSLSWLCLPTCLYATICILQGATILICSLVSFFVVLVSTSICQPSAMAEHLGIEFMEAEELYQKRVLTITGICVALLLVGILCVVAYCKTKKQRKKMHNHMRQNMCPEHPNRNLANGPNHPGPGPEEIPMVDYISKNVPATERVIRPATERSFPASHASSRSNNSSTRAHSSTQRHEERTWSLERSESFLSDSPGMMSSSVGTSKCSSPACMEARAWRAAHCVYSDPHRPGLQYGDSFDSLGDSPHSDR
ncbi:hypothetical protein CHARACLAT_028092 [Characodon lateralis]|uniref:Neuregulin C-terminal domain-containing protein n=1 Tax=Characodon lateralis TaxID=208331 RepID=A0ABU7EXE5_9TELE|nr:hypothetical protein [Characodon lateralis]